MCCQQHARFILRDEHQQHNLSATSNHQHICKQFASLKNFKNQFYLLAVLFQIPNKNEPAQIQDLIGRFQKKGFCYDFW